MENHKLCVCVCVQKAFQKYIKNRKRVLLAQGLGMLSASKGDCNC